MHRSLLVGGPSDGARIEVPELMSVIMVADPISRGALNATPIQFCFGRSVYKRSDMLFPHYRLHIYAHESLDLPDAWWRLIERYPQPNERY